MKLVAALARWVRIGRPCTAPRRVAAACRGPEPAPDKDAGGAVAPAAADADDLPRGCGWFDSSWSLRQGLQVTEHVSVHEMRDELPLRWWLVWQAGADPAAVSSAPARTTAASRRRAR